ncbi:MAG TPA: isoamylase [Polyangia bacterium]
MANGRTSDFTLDARGAEGISARAGTGAAPTLARSTQSRDWFAERGAPYPVGAVYLADERAYNFTLYSRNGERVELLLFGDDVSTPLRQVVLDPLKNRSGRVWHVRVAEDDIPGARHYAYRVDGPQAPGNRFDPDKLLLDPYARAVFFPPTFSRAAASLPGSNLGRAGIAVLPRPRPAFDWSGDKRPRHTHDTVIYEMHVGGFTRHETSGVAGNRAGTYLGVIDKIPYLKELGVTAVELLPVHHFDPEAGGNYWGYMPLCFFAPHQGYTVSADPLDHADEFKTMVKELHKADIEVILDVVYNHTTEQGDGGPTYSFRGIDNGAYYLMTPGLDRYRDETGTGNTIRSSHPASRKLITNSLRHWVDEMHVDGFRFDLASIFTRDDSGAVNTVNPPIIEEISSDPAFMGVRLIAEAWDISSYQLGRTFPGPTWWQWNGQFRDDIRTFVKSDPRQVHNLMRRLYGSDDLFPDTLPEVYRPHQSVNFVTCHDGFCLRDLVSYQQKRNLANGNGNRDGTDDNRSWNCGWEGDDGAPAEVQALRRRQIKNFCALLFLANGTPMFCAGDEFMNTQGGNNNPYNQNNPTTWLHWDLLQQNAEMFRFWKLLIAFRKAHPSLGRDGFWRGDIRWYGVEGGVDFGDDSRSLAYFLAGDGLGDSDFYVLINAFWGDLNFRLQEGTPGQWRRVIDTAKPSPEDVVDPGQEVLLTNDSYLVAGRSVVVFERRRT